jgi:hypothetical protein
MSFINLKDDLIREFREERDMINDQIEILDPLATSLRKPAAHHILSAGALIACELVCYGLCLGGIVFLFFLSKVYPFSTLFDIFYNPRLHGEVNVLDLTYLNIAVYGLVVLAAILFYIIARMSRAVRLKNSILNQAGRDIKTIVGQHLKRKAAIDTIEQRHLLGMPGIIEDKTRVNQVPNPGYGNENIVS